MRIGTNQHAANNIGLGEFYAAASSVFALSRENGAASVVWNLSLPFFFLIIIIFSFCLCLSLSSLSFRFIYYDCHVIKSLSFFSDIAFSWIIRNYHRRCNEIIIAIINTIILYHITARVAGIIILMAFIIISYTVHHISPLLFYFFILPFSFSTPNPLFSLPSEQTPRRRQCGGRGG